MSELKLVELFLTLYGPLAIGWLAALALALGMWRMHIRHRDELNFMARSHREDLAEVTKIATEALTANSRAMAELTIRFNDWFMWSARRD